MNLVKVVNSDKEVLYVLHILAYLVFLKNKGMKV